MPNKNIKRRFDSSKGISHIRFPTHKSKSLNINWNGVLDKSISIKDILKYGCVILLLLLIIFAIFMFGRWSVSSSCNSITSKTTAQSAKQNITPISSSSLNKTTVTLNKTTKNKTSTDSLLPVTKTKVESGKKENLSNTTNNSQSAALSKQEGIYDEAKFGHPYNKVTIGIGSSTREVRGDDWATLKSMVLTVVNNEKVVITPSKIKIKIYTKGGASDWWDDTVKLPIDFHNMKPGSSVSKKLSVHASFSDIEKIKEIKVRLLDEFDSEITTKTETAVFS